MSGRAPSSSGLPPSAPSSQSNNGAAISATPNNNSGIVGTDSSSSTTSNVNTSSDSHFNDDSNPQQGSSGSPARRGTGGRDVSSLSEPVATANMGKESNSNETASPPGAATVVVPGSSPTRGPHPRPSLKIPPFQRDARKLFVGGLPADSKYCIKKVVCREPDWLTDR